MDIPENIKKEFEKMVDIALDKDVALGIFNIAVDDYQDIYLLMEGRSFYCQRDIMVYLYETYEDHAHLENTLKQKGWID